MSWDAVVFDFEDTLVDLSRGRPRKGPPAYYSGARGMPAVKDRDGRPVLDAVTQLIEAGTPVAVITASPEPAMRRWFSEQHFTLPVVVIGFHDTVLHRPSPHPLLEALHQLGQVPSPRVLSVGDSGDDTEAARRAGLTPGSVRSFVPLAEPPDLFLPWVDSFFDDRRVQRLAGDLCDGSGVTLEAEVGEHRVRAGGRVRNQPRSRLSGLLDQARSGVWPPELVRLALRLVEDALAAAGLQEAVLTWVPPHAGREDHMKGLMANLKAATGLPTTRLLRFRNDPGPQSGRARAQREGAMEGTLDLRSQVDLAGRHVFVVDDLRDTGATLEESSRVLRAAGAASVTGLVLVQQEHRGSDLYARYAEPAPLRRFVAQRAPAALAGADAALEAGAETDTVTTEVGASAETATAAEGMAAASGSTTRAPERRPAAPTPPSPRTVRPGAGAPPRLARPTVRPAPPTAWPVGERSARAGSSAGMASEPESAPVEEAPAQGATSWPSLIASEPGTPDDVPPAREGRRRAADEVLRDPVAIKARFPHAYQRWAPEDDETLARMFTEGRRVSEMMEALGRQKKSIESRIRKLQLYVVVEGGATDAEVTAEVAAVPAMMDEPPADDGAAQPFVPPEALKERFPRAYQRWTPEEDAELTRLFAEGRSLEELCVALGRQAKSVETRIRRLEIDVTDEELQAGAE